MFDYVRCFEKEFIRPKLFRPMKNVRKKYIIFFIIYFILSFFN